MAQMTMVETGKFALIISNPEREGLLEWTQIVPSLDTPDAARREELRLIFARRARELTSIVNALQLAGTGIRSQVAGVPRGGASLLNWRSPDPRSIHQLAGHTGTVRVFGPEFPDSAAGF